jgi:hypothetical protein
MPDDAPVISAVSGSGDGAVGMVGGAVGSAPILRPRNTAGTCLV